MKWRKWYCLLTLASTVLRGNLIWICCPVHPRGKVGNNKRNRNRDVFCFLLALCLCHAVPITLFRHKSVSSLLNLASLELARAKWRKWYCLLRLANTVLRGILIWSCCSVHPRGKVGNSKREEEGNEDVFYCILTSYLPLSPSCIALLYVVSRVLKHFDHTPIKMFHNFFEKSSVKLTNKNIKSISNK